MYPRTYFETFMRYEAQDEVFVAMPFTEHFRAVYDNIIEPAIRRVTVRGKPLTPRIINRATSGSPDIHEQIFDAILHSRLVIADMTVQSSYTAEDGRARWQANANVAYEVGLASAWRNPEDVLLIHQGHPDHSYSFDVQNLRHVSYDPNDKKSIVALSEEIVRAINQSTFLAKRAYEKILYSVSPSTIQFMHQEVARAFPVISFPDQNMPIFDSRIHAASELLSFGALRNRNVLSQGEGKGAAVIYEWSELGLRMLVSLHAATPERVREIRTQIESVAPGAIPPQNLREIPKVTPVLENIDMIEASAVDNVNEAEAVEPSEPSA
jgi:hypothetical protein